MLNRVLENRVAVLKKHVTMMVNMHRCMKAFVHFIRSASLYVSGSPHQFIFILHR